MQTGNKLLYILTMKKIFTLTIFSLIILLSCGKSKEEKALDDLRNISDKFMEESGEDWGKIDNDLMEDYMENTNDLSDNVVNEAMDDILNGRNY